MQGVTTALVLFIFACVAFPKMVRSKPQFYIAVALTAVIIVLDALRFMVTNAGADDRPGGLGVVLYVLVALAQFLAFVALILGSGGVSMKELADDMAGSFEAVRQGDPGRTVAPLGGGKRRRDADANVDDDDDDDDEGRVVYTIDSPDPARPASTGGPSVAAPPPAPASASRPAPTDPIPLDDDDDDDAPIPYPGTTPPPQAGAAPTAPASDLPPPPDRRHDTTPPR